MLNRLLYWRRIFSAYVIGKTSQLTFWHEEPKINNMYSKKNIGPYYMQFSNKANYTGFLDAKGIPLLNYQGNIGKQYNPIAIAQWGLGNYNLWKKYKEGKNFKTFLLSADWLESALESNAKGYKVWMHNFDFEYRDTLKNPWYSGLAQGQGLSVLIRAYKETGNIKYKNAAKDVYLSLNTEIKNGGVCFQDANRNMWIEEYIVDPPTHILNGFIWSLWGIYDFALCFNDQSAMKVFNNFSKTISSNLNTYDLKYWSKYEHSGTIVPMIASLFYHKLHITQLQIMYDLTNDKVYSYFYKKWQEYLNKTHFRLISKIHKLIFKVFYY